jgi:hypothetical protein
MDISFTKGLTGEIHLPKLQSLKLYICGCIPWGDLKAPRITDLFCDGTVKEGFVAFISSHRSIKRLRMDYSKDHTATIISSLPQLVNLTINPFEELCDTTQIQLSNLENLTLYHYKKDSIPLKLFERIVQSRFLPAQASTNQKEAAKPIPSLTVLVRTYEEIMDIQWINSPLLSLASREVEEETYRLEGTFDSYTFRWT